MDHETLLTHMRRALESISNPRFFETERGFQGAFLAALEKNIPDHVLPQGAVIEQEYQKRLGQHGVTVRPDIIIHEPFDAARHATRQDGNVAVIELKLNASQADARGDFDSLEKMMAALSYPMAIFINIASEKTHAGLVPDTAKGRVTCFAVSIREGSAHVVEERT
jgi:hypothetical protein